MIKVFVETPTNKTEFVIDKNDQIKTIRERIETKETLYKFNFNQIQLQEDETFDNAGIKHGSTIMIDFDPISSSRKTTIIITV